MGSYPRREKAETEARERADAVPALDCQDCGALTPGERFRYFADQIICEACGNRNPQSPRRLVLRVLLQPRTICVNFIEGRSLVAQAMAFDQRTMLAYAGKGMGSMSIEAAHATLGPLLGPASATLFAVAPS